MPGYEYEGLEPSEPQQQTSIQHAITAAPRPAPMEANGKDHSCLPYSPVEDHKRRARVVRLLDIPSRRHIA